MFSHYNNLKTSDISLGETEYLFLKLREKSVGENLDLMYSEKGKRTPIQIDVRKIKAPKRTKKENKVSITDKGEKLFHEIFPKHVHVIRDHFKSLTDDEKETLANLLKTVGFTAERLKEQKV